MSFNTFGRVFRFSTWGESHGPALGALVDGCPPGLALSEADIQPFLDKRRPGTSRFTTQMALFHKALEGKGPVPVTSADSRRALEIVTAFYHSSETREEVPFPIGATHPKYESWLPEGFR